MRVKQSVRDLEPYRPNTQAYTVKLDANESANYLFPEGFRLQTLAVNRYPDSSSAALRATLAATIGVPAEQIIVGNGSSEMLELALKTYVEAGDVVLSIEPSFVMYRVYAKIHGARFESVPLKADFSVDMTALIAAIERYHPTIVFLCSPNNPTGLLLDAATIETVLKATQGLVILDEAYIEFAEGVESYVKQATKHPRLIVLRTLSKAYGLAGARVGYLVAHPERIEALNRVKSPYNINMLSQSVAQLALRQADAFAGYIAGVKIRRASLIKALKQFPITVWPSAANFVFFHTQCADLGDQLAKRGILIRGFTGSLTGYYRVTVGDTQEIDALMIAMQEVFDDASSGS